MKKVLCVFSLVLVMALLPMMAVAESGASESGKIADLYDVQIKIGGVTYQLPATLAQFEQNGWVIGDEKRKNEMLTPSHYTSVTMISADPSNALGFDLDFLNADINSRKIADCPVAGFSDNYYSEGLDVELAGGIRFLQSTGEEIRAAYGEPTYLYEGDSYIEWQYSLSDAKYSFNLEGEDRRLSSVRFTYLVDPAVDFVIPERVSAEPPADVVNYVKPDALGDKLLSGNFEIYGQVYALPVPVRTLLNDGWKILKTSDDGYAIGRGRTFIALYKDNSGLSTFALNVSDDAALVENCVIDSLTISESQSGKTFMLPSGLRIGMSYDELRASLGGMIGNTDERDEYDELTFGGENAQREIIARVGKETNLVEQIDVKQRG